MMENKLLKKLHIKAGFNVNVINPPINIDSIIGNVPNDIFFNKQKGPIEDAILIFAISQSDLYKQLQLINLSNKTICWIFYPKVKSSITSDLNLMQNWQELDNFQLSPCGAVSINETWTALRIKPTNAINRSGIGNKEISNNTFGEYIDVENKKINLPKDLAEALSYNQKASDFFESLSYSNKKEYVLWILTAKQEKTRTDRLHKTIEKLLIAKKNPSEK